MIRLALAAGLALGACADVPVDDLTAEARSPDGMLVARLWCDDFCDVPGRTVLTIEPATRAVRPAPGDAPGDHPRGTMPPGDIAAILYAHGSAPDRLSWTDRRTLILALSCPSDGNRRTRRAQDVSRRHDPGPRLVPRRTLPVLRCGRAAGSS